MSFKDQKNFAIKIKKGNHLKNRGILLVQFPISTPPQPPIVHLRPQTASGGPIIV
jgi:hypothetical protein